MNKEDYKNVKDAAEMLGVTPGRVNQLLGSGQLKGWKVNGRAWLVSVREIERRIKELAE